MISMISTFRMGEKKDVESIKQRKKHEQVVHAQDYTKENVRKIENSRIGYV